MRGASMAISFASKKSIRKSFGRVPEVAPMPNLIEVQKSSYDHFLQMGIGPEQRAGIGLQEVFRSVFPIRDFSERAQLEFVRYELETPKYEVDECQQRGITFAAPLKVTLRLVVWDVDEDTASRSIRDIKEQDVYMGDMPLMTKNGTFIINGTERVIVSQMHRSPGVFFDHDKGKTHLRRGLFLIAARGSTSSSTPKTTFMSGLTGAANCQRRRCFSPSTMPPPRNCGCAATPRAGRCSLARLAACPRKRFSPAFMEQSHSAAALRGGWRRSGKRISKVS